MAIKTKSISITIPTKLDEVLTELVKEHNLHSKPEDKASKSQFITEAICFFLDTISSHAKKSNDRKEN